MQKIKISIVTVCLNTVNSIRETIESVLGQTYDNMEYVIIDGMSVDGTLDIIRQYEDIQGVKTYSGKDSGLYNAMNKGIDLCSGDYALFLNSGDVFADQDAVSDVVALICGSDAIGNGWMNKRLLPDIVYGNVTKIYSGKSITEKYSGRTTVFKLLMMGKMPCHQGIFTKASVLRRFRFDESYKICADFDFLLRCLHAGVRMRYVDTTISVVDCITGISSQKTNIDRMRAEDDRSIRENYPLMFWLMWMPKKIVRIWR